MTENRQIALPIPYAHYTVKAVYQTPSYAKWLVAYIAGQASWDDKPIDDSLLLEDDQVMLRVSPGGELEYRIPLVGELYQDYLAAVAPDSNQTELYEKGGLTIQVAELADQVSVTRPCHLVGEREVPLSYLELSGLPLSGTIPETGILTLSQLAGVGHGGEMEITLRAEWLLNSRVTWEVLNRATLIAPVIKTWDCTMGESRCQHLVGDRVPVGPECQLWSCMGGWGYLHHRRLEDGRWEQIPVGEPLPPVTAVYLLEREMWERLSSRPELVIVDTNMDDQMLDGYQLLYSDQRTSVYRRLTTKSACSAIRAEQ